MPFFRKVRHIDFKFLLKADDDTFVCVERLANFLHNQPEESKDKLYAGVPTSCNAPSNPARNVRARDVGKKRCTELVGMYVQVQMKRASKPKGAARVA